MLAEALAISIAMSLDSLVSGFAYGNNKIKIPLLSVSVISGICSIVLAVSVLAGSFLKNFLPHNVTVVICFAVLLLLGLSKLLDSVTKSIIRKHANLKRQIKFSCFNISFILHLCANPEEADVDRSKIISPAEAVSLAIALSLDGIAVGFGAAVGNTNGVLLFVCSFVVDAVCILSGCFLGNKLAGKTPFNLSWLSGVLLILLAFWKLS